MKKKITRPDGSVEEVEGSPQEIATYERIVNPGASDVRKDEQASGSKRLLTEQQLDQLQKALEGIKDDVSKIDRYRFVPITNPWPPYQHWPCKDWWYKTDITWEVRYPDSYTVCSFDSTDLKPNS